MADRSGPGESERLELLDFLFLPTNMDREHQFGIALPSQLPSHCDKLRLHNGFHWSQS